MNTPNNLEWLKDALDSIVVYEGDDSMGKEYQAGYNDMVLAARLMKEQIYHDLRQTIATKLLEAKLVQLERLYKNGTITKQAWDYESAILEELNTTKEQV